MKRPDRRQVTLIFAILGIAALLLLATGLTGLQLSQGELLALLNTSLIHRGTFVPPGGELMLSIMRWLYLVGWLALPVVIIYMLINPKYRNYILKELAKYIPALAMIILIFFLASQYSEKPPEVVSTQGTPGGQTTPAPEETMYPEPLPAVLDAPPDYLLIAVGVGLAILITAITGGMALWVLARRGQRETVETLAAKAETALEAIQRGEDLRSIILRCYFDMSLTLRNEYDIRRSPGLTPSEFEEQLVENHNLPREPVRQLTRLFEKVRYGAEPAGPDEERQAMASLTAIIDASRGRLPKTAQKGQGGAAL